MPLLLADLAERIGAELRGDGACEIRAVATLERAVSGDLAFLANRRYRRLLSETKASAVVLGADDVNDCPCAALVLANPYLGFARAAAMLNPPPVSPTGVDPAATVSADADVAPSAWIGPRAVVEAGARIERGVFVGPGCVIGRDSTLGEDSRLVANVSICHGVHIGKRALVHPGVVIGGDGFGIANDNGVWVKVPQLGGVRIGDDVEIGANTTIDRGALDDTLLEDGVKLDNQVQVGHNVRIGAHTAIAGCVAIAGSVRIGRHCAIGGSSAIAGHLEIADGVQLTGASAVPNSILEPGTYSSGMPIQDNRTWRKNMARLRHLDDLARRVKALENERQKT